MKTFSNRIGDIILHQIVEIPIDEVLQEIIPQATPDQIASIDWMGAPYVDENNRLKGIVQCIIVEMPSRLLVIDTCIGNDKARRDVPQWAGLQLPFLSALRQLGFERGDITDVICTHLHMDHVGWNTMLENGVWVPTFSSARYHFSREEYEYWKGSPANEIEDDVSAFGDSVAPIVSSGLASLVSSDADLGDGIRLFPSPGHTPGHVCVEIDAGTAKLIVSGDFLHHPCQIARPLWSTAADFSKEMAAETRRTILQRIASDENCLLIGSHFCLPSLGRVISQDNGDYRFEPDDE